jgi:hypothetical protein
MSVRSSAIQPVLYVTTAASAATTVSGVIFTKVFSEGVYLVTGTLNMTGTTLSEARFFTGVATPLYKLTAAQTETTVPVSYIFTSDGTTAFSISAVGTGATWSSAARELQIVRLSVAN